MGRRVAELAVPLRDDFLKANPLGRSVLTGRGQAPCGYTLSPRELSVYQHAGWRRLVSTLRPKGPPFQEVVSERHGKLGTLPFLRSGTLCA